MKKWFVFVLVSIISVSLFSAPDRPIKVLHMTFHEGCKKDFEEVAQELNLDLTTWFVQQLPQGFWEGFSAGNEIYNVGPRRAQRVWDRHKDFFDQFDVIVTSDTAPLSRIFLQNNWKKPLVIWICNRFDYRHGSGGEDRFPDGAYYNLIRQATQQENVRLIAYTPYEHEYMRRRGIEMGRRSIKPLGRKEEVIQNFKSSVPENINKAESLFIFPRLMQNQINHVQRECASQGVATWSGVYNGPEDLKGFKGVLFVPYAFSNLALFENLQRGIVHFVPTIQFLTQLGFIRGGMHGNLDWSEWYFQEYADYLVYFNSWVDLKQKMAMLDYDAMKQKIRAFGQQHRKQMVDEWKQLFAELL